MFDTNTNIEELLIKAWPDNGKPDCIILGEFQYRFMNNLMLWRFDRPKQKQLRSRMTARLNKKLKVKQNSPSIATAWWMPRQESE
jgi:hypothetical protein